MKTTRKGLRDNELYKDTYERLTCSRCDEQLKTQRDPEEVYAVRICPECDRKWEELH
jgi:hypothetical protein